MLDLCSVEQVGFLDRLTQRRLKDLFLDLCMHGELHANLLGHRGRQVGCLAAIGWVDVRHVPRKSPHGSSSRTLPLGWQASRVSRWSSGVTTPSVGAMSTTSRLRRPHMRPAWPTTCTFRGKTPCRRSARSCASDADGCVGEFACAPHKTTAAVIRMLEALSAPTAMAIARSRPGGADARMALQAAAGTWRRPIVNARIEK